jgi:hypothetical protein
LQNNNSFGILAEVANHLTSLQLPPLGDLAVIVDGMNLKDRLRYIQSDRNDPAMTCSSLHCGQGKLPQPVSGSHPPLRLANKS